MAEIDGEIKAHEISQTVEFLPQQASTVSPPCNLSIEEVEEEAAKGEPEGRPQMVLVVGEEVASSGKQGECTTETIHDCH